MSGSAQEALADELALLESMYPYPDVVVFDKMATQLDFTHNKFSLSLRIPPDYPLTSLPQTLCAIGPLKRDLRDVVQRIVRDQDTGEPCLDAIIARFIELVDADVEEVNNTSPVNVSQGPQIHSVSSNKTVIIYLHHLLALSKRKLALNPSTNAASVSGITKPGYPGVLVFAGLADAVDAHVRELKDQNWQAFQVRMEDDEAWSFKHDDGIIEVETMSEVVTAIGEARKKDFLAAMKMVG